MGKSKRTFLFNLPLMGPLGEASKELTILLPEKQKNSGPWLGLTSKFRRSVHRIEISLALVFFLKGLTSVSATTSLRGVEIRLQAIKECFCHDPKEDRLKHLQDSLFLGNFQSNYAFPKDTNNPDNLQISLHEILGTSFFFF